MSAETKVRLPQDLKDSIEKDAKQGNFASVNQWWIEAGKHFLECKKAHQVASFRFIITRFKGKCLKCGRSVDKGEGAYYARGSGLLCLECSIFKGMSDKAVVAKYMKMREFQELARMFKVEVERYAERLDLYRAADKLDEIYKRGKELKDLVFKYLKEFVGQPEERQALEEIIKLTEQELKTLMDLENFLAVKMKRKLKKAAGVV